MLVVRRPGPLLTVPAEMHALPFRAMPVPLCSNLWAPYCPNLNSLMVQAEP